MDTRLVRPITSISLLIVLILSCTVSLPTIQQQQAPQNPVNQMPPDAIFTAAAQTLIAQLTQNAPLQITPSATLQEIQLQNTSTLVQASFTPLISDTPPFTDTPMSTSTPNKPTITASMNTNCRSGPGPAYPAIGSLEVGETSYVYGRNSAKTWWYIENPRNLGHYCWVWGETTIVSGDTSVLQVITPPPPPATATTTGVSFSASYATRHKCSGDWYAYISLKNKGGSDFESGSLKLRDQTDDVVLDTYSSDEPFLSSTSDCPDGHDSLDVGKSAYIAAKLGDVDEGHEIKATVYLCTKEGLSGKCETVVIRFSAP